MPYTLLQLGSIFEWRIASQQIGNPRSPQGQLQQTQKNCNSARIAARTPLEPTSSPVNLPSPWCEKKKTCFEAEEEDARGKTPQRRSVEHCPLTAPDAAAKGRGCGARW
jgi:hypothetical protein